MISRMDTRNCNAFFMAVYSRLYERGIESAIWLDALNKTENEGRVIVCR